MKKFYALFAALFLLTTIDASAADKEPATTADTTKHSIEKTKSNDISRLPPLFNINSTMVTINKIKTPQSATVKYPFDTDISVKGILARELQINIIILKIYRKEIFLQCQVL